VTLARNHETARARERRREVAGSGPSLAQDPLDPGDRLVDRESLVSLLDELDLLAGVLLEGGDDLAHRLILLSDVPFSHQTTRSAALAPGAARTSAAARTTRMLMG
jgi:hypothetical protein